MKQINKQDKFAQDCEKRYQAVMDWFWLNYQQFPKQPDGSGSTSQKKDISTGDKTAGSLA